MAEDISMFLEQEPVEDTSMFMEDSPTSIASAQEHANIMTTVTGGVPEKEDLSMFEPSWAEQQLEDARGIGELGLSMATSGILSVPAAVAALGTAATELDAKEGLKTFESWMSKAYVPSNPAAKGVMENIGGTMQRLGEATEATFGPETRLISEVGSVLVPGAAALKARPKPWMPSSQERVARAAFEADLIDSPDIRLLKNDPALANRLRQMEAEGLRLGVEFDAETAPLIKTLRTIKDENPALYDRIQDAYFHTVAGKKKKSFQFKELRSVLAEAVGEQQARIMVNRVARSLDKRGKQLKGVNNKLDLLLNNYLPRNMIHPEVLEELGILTQANLRNELRKIDKDFADGKITKLEAESARSKTITKGIDVLVQGKKSKHEKARKRKEIKKELQKAYAPLEDSLEMYFQDTGWAVAERKFLGKGDDVTTQIGKFLESYTDPVKARQVRSALEARFGPNARVGMDKFWNGLKQIGYIGTIADMASALIQLSDLSAAVARQGLRPGALAIKQSLSKKYEGTRMGAISPELVGVVDVMHEMANMRGGLNNKLDTMLKWSGFKATDRFGKKVVLTAARNRLMRDAKNSLENSKKTRTGAPDKFERDYGWLGDDFEQFRKDVANGDIKNENMHFAVVNELLDVQPITLSQMPITYLKMKNGKIFYALKTWAIRQINRYREDAIKGDYDKMVKHITGLYLATESLELVKMVLDSITTGDPIKVDEVYDDAINNLLRLFFLSTYSMGKVAKGDTEEFLEATANLIPAGVGAVGDVAYGIWKSLKEGEVDPDMIKRIPIIGRTTAAMMEKE